MTDDADNLEAGNLDNAKLVTVAERPSEGSAAVLVAVLQDGGIRAVATGGFTSGFRAEAPGRVRVQTLERDAQRAREIIAEIKMETPDEFERAAGEIEHSGE